MQRKLKFYLLFGVLFLSISPFINQLLNFKLLSSNFSHFDIKTSQLYSGNYTGDISLIYFDQGHISSSRFATRSLTQMIPPNISRPGVVYEVNSLDIYAEISYGYMIAGNVSEQISLTPAYAFIQEFVFPDIEKIQAFLIYLNYTITEPIDYYYLGMVIFDENFTVQIDAIWNYEERFVVEEWMPFYPYVYDYIPGIKYNILLQFLVPKKVDETTSLVAHEFDFWKAENYTDPKYDKGLTQYFNGTHIFPVENDTTTDMLCYLLYTEELHPGIIDIDFVINNEYKEPIYSGTYVFLSYSFDAPVTQDINLTIISDRMIPILSVYTDIYYIYLSDADGIYNVHDTYIEWVVNYTFEDIHFGWPPPMFLFERDWDLQKFEDPYLRELTNIYFGPVYLYDVPYYGITTIFGIPLEKGTYIGTFHSPNYCNSINPKLKSESNFITQGSFELGQTIRIEAEILSSIYSNISDGLGNILLRSPSGQVIHNETGITPDGGLLASSEIPLSNEMLEGLYEVEIFWTNGKEVAYYSSQFEVRKPLNLILVIGVSMASALAAVSITLLLRRQIRMRNWEKSLKNLFVLTKDGLSLFEYSFGIEIQDPALISGMIAALTQFVREATGSKKSLRTVDQEDKKVILQHGQYTTTALLAGKDLPIIHKRIRKFSDEFETSYHKNIKTFDGEISAFKNADVIVNKYFPIDVEEQIIRGVREKLIEFRERLDVLTDPRHIISLMREITEFLSRYRAIVNENYLDYYNEIIIGAEQKIANA
ncbi:MAG: hypothetical protein ACFFBZ_07070 [Promethearchaeota archaeon]